MINIPYDNQTTRKALTPAQKKELQDAKTAMIKNCVSIIHGFETTAAERDIIVSILNKLTIYHQGHFDDRMAELHEYEMTLLGIFYSHGKLPTNSTTSSIDPKSVII